MATKNIEVINDIEVIMVYDHLVLSKMIIGGYEIEIIPTDDENEKNIINYIIDNIGKIIGGITITEVTEEPFRHPHYYGCETHEIFFDEEEGLMSVVGCSGSPTAWNYYKTPIWSLNELAEEIPQRVDEAKSFIEEERYDVFINEDILNLTQASH